MHGLLFLKTLFHPENIQKFIEERSYEKKYQAYKEEKEIEYSLINGEFLNVKPDEFKDMVLYKPTDEFIVTGKQNGDYTLVKNKRTNEQGFIYSRYLEPNSSEGKITVRIMDLFK